MSYSNRMQTNRRQDLYIFYEQINDTIGSYSNFLALKNWHIYIRVFTRTISEKHRKVEMKLENANRSKFQEDRRDTCISLE